VAKLVDGPDHRVYQDPFRGLDQGAYVPLMEMYPEADVPILQISMPTLDPRILFDLGRRLAPLREQGVLIVGSGFATHNLREMDWHGGPYAEPPSWSEEFDDWLKQTIAAQDIDSLLDFQNKAPAWDIAHPRTDHFAPLFIALGAVYDGFRPQNAVEGFWFGLSKRSVQFD
jgi:4,5-DOPA dioxygenase extradiol